MDTVFDLDEYMMAFITELEKGNQSFVLGFGYPAHVCKATFEKDNFFLKSDLPKGEGPVHECFFTRPDVLSVPKHLYFFLQNTDAIGVSETFSTHSKVELKLNLSKGKIQNIMHIIGTIRRISVM